MAGARSGVHLERATGGRGYDVKISTARYLGGLIGTAAIDNDHFGSSLSPMIQMRQLARYCVCLVQRWYDDGQLRLNRGRVWHVILVLRNMFGLVALKR